MAYVDSSVNGASALAQAPAPGPDDEALEGATGQQDDAQEEEERDRRPKERPSGSLAKMLEDQIDDINLARYIDDDTLDQIGMDCIREYELDENSRSKWVTRAVAAMKFATQDTTPKTSPWSGASNVIFPMIAQSAIDFASRTYPAMIQNRNVVKGAVWGGDDGTPATKDSDPDGDMRLSSGDTAPQPKNQLMGGAATSPLAAAAAPQPQQPGPAPGAGAPPGPQPAEPLWVVEPGEKQKRADRIGEHMSWQLLDDMPEWEPQTDQGLHQMPVAGGFVRKTFYDPVERKNRSLVVSLMNLVWNYHAPSFEGAPRHSEKLLVYPHQITEYERFEDDSDDESGGMWLRREYGAGGGAEGMRFNYDDEVQQGGQDDPDAPHFFIEQHRRLDLDEDGYAEPYIVTVHHRSGKVVRIVARYDDDGIDASDDGDTIERVAPVDHYTLYPFLPNLDGGSYPMGFGHLLKPLNAAINTAMNQMFDAATLQNAGGGFVSDQLGAPAGDTLFKVGKFVRVNSKGGAIRDAIYPIDFKGPSATLFQLLGLLIDSSKEIASLASVLSGDAAVANAPPTTILALIEQGMKLYNAIYKRVWRAEKSELGKLYRLNRIHLPDIARYQIGDEWRTVTKEDYRLGGGVVPVADPTMTTDMQRLGRAEILMQFKDDPLIDQKEIRRRLFEAAGFERIDKLFVAPDPTAAMMAMARAQAELGKIRSEEQKNNTQAFLNLALARKNATAQEEVQLEAQLQFFRLRIEAVNAQTRADAVRHSYHSTHIGALTDMARMEHEAGMHAADLAADGGAEPTPGPTGPLPLATGAPPGPAVNRPVPGGPPSDLAAPPAPLQQSQE